METTSQQTCPSVSKIRKARVKLTPRQKTLMAHFRKTVAAPTNQRRLEAFLEDLSQYVVTESIRELLANK